MISYYSEDQLEIVLPYLSRTPKWFILGGPADGNEAQCAAAWWPGVRIIGLEPNPEACRWQLNEGNWPTGQLLMPLALAETSRVIEMVREPGAVRNASADADALEWNRTKPGVEFYSAPAVSLDMLDFCYGPFEDAVVWLDIEGSEYLALQGAVKLLERRVVSLWNLEMQSRVPGLMEGIEGLMDRYGYRTAHEWNASAGCRDRIYILRSTRP